MMEMNKKSLHKANSITGFFCKENFPLISLIVLVIYAIASILVSILVLKISIIPVCIMVVLEALLAACLNKIPLWIHGIVFIAQIVAGIMADKLVLMILVSIIYVLSIVFLYIWSRNE